MKIEKVLNDIKSLEKEYKLLKKDFKRHKIFEGKSSIYMKEDKESFKLLWKRYIVFFVKIRKLIKNTKYRRYFFYINYNKIVLRKHVLLFYFNVLVDIESGFGKHENFIRIFLSENFKKDYLYFARYIYKPNYLNLIRTPNIFIKAFKGVIRPDLYKLIDKEVLDLKDLNNFKTDYNNLYFYLKSIVDKFLFAASSKVSYTIGKIRFSPRSKGLIKEKNLEKYLDIAKPGDILLTRGNWEASNLSIRGFWKHMSIYLGKGKYIKKHFSYDFVDDLKDDFHYIIESTSDGIKIVKIEHLTGTNDYLGVSRTKFKKEKIHRAISNSFNSIGKGYDYRFNFHSDSNLVCSELVLKSFAKEYKGDEGIEIDLEDIGISLIYPPNNFLNILKDKKQKVEPVFFIDSIEKTGENFVSTVDEFIKSRKRSRSSLFVK